MKNVLLKNTVLQLSAILLVVMLSHSEMQAQVRWMQDETVRAGAGTGMEVKMAYNNAHSVAAIGASRFITWVRTDSLFVAESVAGGAWSAPRFITRSLMQMDFPSTSLGPIQMNLPTIAATSDGRLCIGWHEPNGVKTTFSTDGGKTWGGTQILASRGAALSLAAGQNGVLYALWHSGGDDIPSDMMFATWQNGVWSAAKAIDAASATNAALWGSLCVVGNSIYAVWRENTSGQFRVYLTRSHNGGTTWDTPRSIVSDDRSGDPTVAADSRGNIVVAYQRNQQIYITNSGDDGATFTTPRNIGSGLFARVIGNESGFFALAWERFMGSAQNDQGKQTGFVYSTDYGWTFSKDSALSATGAKLGLVQFTGANEITASWFNVNNGGTVVAKRASVGAMVTVREYSALKAVIFPNPASGLITLRLPASVPESRVRIVNMLGNEVLRASVEGVSPSLDISLLARGAYMIEVQQGSVLTRQRLILQ